MSKLTDKPEEIKDSPSELWMFFPSKKPMNITEFYTMLKEDLFLNPLKKKNKTLNFSELPKKLLDLTKSLTLLPTMPELSDSLTPKFKSTIPLNSIYLPERLKNMPN